MKFAKLPPTKQIGPYGWNHQALLGQGSFGKVYLGKNLKENDDKFVAIKIMANSNFNNKEMKESLENEIKILKILKGHPFTLGLEDHLQSTNNQYIIQRFCNGGDLRSLLSKRNIIPEAEARQIFSDMLHGMREMFSKKLIHRDLKPENTLIHDKQYFIADFGFSAEVPNFQNQKMTFYVGTPLYMSPQILTNQPYTTKCDIWSLGIIYYEILCGKTPFPCESMEQLKKNILHMQVTFPHELPLSTESKEFIKHCLQVDEAKRMPWETLLNYPLFFNPLIQSVIQVKPKLNLDQKAKDIIKQLQTVIAQYHIDVQQLFNKFDTSGDHQLDLKEFGQLLAKLDPSLNVQEVEAIFRQFDTLEHGTISFADFRAHTLETTYHQQSPQEQRMLMEMRAEKVIKLLKVVIERECIDVNELFEKYDANGDHQLQMTEFAPLILSIDNSLSQNEISYIFKDFDKDGSGTINTEEFITRLGLSKQLFRLHQEAVLRAAPAYSVMVSHLISQDEKYNEDYVKGVYSKLSNSARVLVNKLKQVITNHNLDIKSVFQRFDADHSGNIDHQEFDNLIQTYLLRRSPKEAMEVFSAINTAQGGTISYNEFEAFFRRPNVWKMLAERMPCGDSQEDEGLRKELFKLFDPNHNGLLSLAEVDKGIRDVLQVEELFHCKQAIARAFHAAKNYIKKGKKHQQSKNEKFNRGDYVEYDEFKYLLIFLRQYFEYNVMFQRIDSSHDRRIDIKEFKSAIQLLQKWGVTITDPEKEFRKIDKNKGGVILFDEFAFWAINNKLDLEDDDDFRFEEALLNDRQNFCANNIK